MAIAIQEKAPLWIFFDKPTSIKFNRDVLGFEIVTTPSPQGEHFDWALLRLNGVELMLNTAYEEDARLRSLIPLALPPTTIRKFISAARMWMRRTRTSARAALLRRSPKSGTMA